MADDGQIVVTVTMDTAAKGLLQNLGGFVETVSGSRSYRFTGTAAAAQTAIQGIQFVPSGSYLFPPNQPGRTDFTISATDSAFNLTTRVLPIILVSDTRNFMVTSLLDDVTLPGTLRYAVAVAASNDVITFALPTYPAVIRLNTANGPLVIQKHLTFLGPGADKLTISGDSNANGITDVNDVQLFRVLAGVHMKGLTLTRGYAATGGAISIDRLAPTAAAGTLTLEDCIISHCLASQWGGAIDVVEGSVTIERCLFDGNALNASSGLGGGAISLYTNASCSFLNTTFSGNSQAAPTGYGGGAIYVENFTPNRFFQTLVTHCTFAGNIDAANRGSSIQSNVSNTRVLLANSLFADFSARNLLVAGGGEIVSSGGNISNDNTTTTLIQGGVPQLSVLLNQATDKRNTNPLLAPLATVEGQTRGHRPLSNSPAIGAAVAGLAAVDQRGVIRNATTDSGALDADALGKLIIHEIFAPQTTANPHFIEFFNPRDQVALDLSGFEIWIDGLKRHVFSGSQIIQPGHGIILADSPTLTPVAAHPGTPVVLPSIAALTADLDLTARSRIELRAPSATGAKVVEAVSYVAVFANIAAPATTLNTDADSITLAPQFQGAAFVPHSLVQPPPNGGVLLAATGAHTSPGADTGATPFGAPNAYPIAVSDRFSITEDEVATLDVLANDLDADGSDKLFVVDLNTAKSVTPPSSNKASITSAAGAAVTITPGTSPLRGTMISYDPRVAFNHLPEGARVTDTFAYSIIDVGGGEVAGFADGGTSTTLVSATSHRLAAGEFVTISGAGIAAYNGSFAIAAVDDNTFRIAVPFAGNPGPSARGHWQAVEARSPSARSEALVEVTVLGHNDPPTPVADNVSTNEDTILRIFADPDLAGVGMSLDTDPLYPLPRQVAASGVLTNDTDPDSSDNPYTQLHVVGVCKASPIGGFSGTSGVSPVTVTATAHGLQTGATVLISGYGGHPSYNGYQLVTVTGPDTFTLPVSYVDNAAPKGLWTVLNDGNRLATTSTDGAEVKLEIRANRIQTNIIYNPRPSSFLNGLALGEAATDTFYYAVQDSHGATSLGLVSVQVAGVNDAPVPGTDPASLATIDPALLGGLTLPQFLGGSTVLYVLPAAGQTGQVNATIRPPGGSATTVIAGLNQTDEDTALNIPSASLLANDQDVDRTNILRLEIGAGQNVSREGAAIRLSADGLTVTYDPTHAPKLQALAFKEHVIDSFYLTVFDGVARVSSLVAVLVEGRNDQPVASNATFTTPEKSPLVVNPPGLLTSGSDIDQNTKLPDNRKFLLPVAPVATTVFGATAGVTLTRHDGAIDGLAPVSGTPGVTRVIATGHGLQSGEEVVLLGCGTLTGQYVLTRVDADSFTVPFAYDSAFASIGGGVWRTLASIFHYDPTGSVFSDSPGGPTFTLQGLAAGQTYTDTFTYTLLDGSYLFANNDIYRIEADRSNIELRVLDNDTNLDGVAGNRRIVDVGPTSAGGTVVMNGDQTLIYTPETGFVGDEVFVYTIEDDLGNRDSAMVTARVTVDRLNGNLHANDDRFTVAAGQVPLLDVLANDNIIPATGDPLALVTVGPAPDHGGQATIENGQIRYTPSVAATTFPYTETFGYTMSGGGSATASATVTVLVVNRANTLNVRADAYSVPASSSHNTLNVLENDNILPGNGEALDITAVGTPAHGSVTIVNGVALSYTPPVGFLGSDSFTYTAADGFGGTGTALVSVEVGYLTTNNDIFSVRYDDPAKTIDDGPTDLDVLANDNVVQGGGGQLTITGVTPTNPLLGAMSIAPGGALLRFDPAPGKTGQQDFVYTVTDVGGRTATGTVTVVVLAAGIRASSDFFTVQTGSQGAELPVLSNDLRISDLPGQLSISAIGTGTNAPDHGGSVDISADYKKLIYTPAAGFSGVESFTYTVTDGDSIDTARVSVRSTVGEMVASPDSFLIFRGSSANRLAVLLNDRVIPDAGQSLFITATGMDPGNLTNPARRGTLEIIENGGALSYTPSSDNLVFPYVETFSYEISSGGTDRVQALIRLEILDRVGARNLETNNDQFTVRGDSLGTLLPVLANDSVLPAGADAWTITDVTPPTANVCSPFLMGDFPDPAALAARLTAHADLLSQYLWARISPSARTSLANTAIPPLRTRITLVAELNTIVEAGSSIYDSARFAGVTLRAQTQSLLSQGVTGEQLIVLNRLLLEDGFPNLIRQASGGGVAQISGANILYAPQPGFVGTERFTYRVSDGLGGTGFGEVIVRVGDISVSDDNYTLLGNGQAVALDVTANDGVQRTASPAPSQPAEADFTLAPERAITVVPPTAGSAVVDGSVVRFTPSASFAGHAVLTYWVDDDSGCQFPGTAYLDIRAPGGDRSSAVVSVTVTGVNDPPKMLNADPGVTTDKVATHPFANATVIEYDDQRAQPVRIRVTYAISQGILAGGFTVISPGVLEFYGTAAQATAALRALVFTPVIDRITVGQTEDTRFTVALDDGFVSTPVIVDSVVTRVTPVNDPPVITGTIAGQKVYQHTSLRPFAGTNITDPDDLKLQPLTVSVQVDSTLKGGLSNLGGFSQTPAGSGIYVFHGTAAAASAALRALVFEPTPGNRVTSTSPEIVGLSLTVNDGFAAPVVNTVTTVVVSHAEVDRLLALDAVGQDASQAAAMFGSSVAVSGNTMVVGSPKRDTPAVDAGRVFVYERNAGFGAPWGQVAEITGSDTVAGDAFGQAVAIAGDVLVVGAPRANPGGINDAGAVYVFRRNPANANAWLQTAKLVPAVTNSGGGDLFGSAVAIQGDTLLVGAPNANLSGAPRSGRVSVFQYASGTSTWTPSQTLTAAVNLSSGNSLDGEFFGCSLAMDGNTAVVGAYGANRGGSLDKWDYGAAYVFSRTATAQPWAELKRLDEFTDAAAKAYDGFGYAVAISGDRILVGVHSMGGDLSSPIDSGRARIYERDFGGPNAWGVVQKIGPSDGVHSNGYGFSVALSGSLALIGSTLATNGTGENRGFAEVYRRSSGATPNWTMIDRFAPGAAIANDRFGTAMALDGFTGIISSAFDSVNATNAATAGCARVYQFQFDLGPRLTIPVADQVATTNIPITFAVNPATFDDPIYPGSLTVSARLSNGNPLPAAGWLSFNPVTAIFSGTPTPANRDNYDLVLAATNPLGSTIVSNVFHVTVAATLQSAYQTWAAAHFPQAAQGNAVLETSTWGMLADPDGDGITNLMEMLFGTLPDHKDPSQLTFQRISDAQSSVTFPISKDFPLASMHVEWSADMNIWSLTGVAITTQGDSQGVVWATAVVTPPTPQVKLFVRIAAGP